MESFGSDQYGPEEAPVSAPEGNVNMYRNFASRYLQDPPGMSADTQAVARKAMETMNTPLYAAVAHAETASHPLANQVHACVLDEGMFVLFLDRWYERNDEQAKERATHHHEQVLSHLLPWQQQTLLALEQELFKFWDLEQTLRAKMRANASIPDAQFKEFALRKSTDTFFYSTLTKFFVPTMPRSLMQEFYMHQLLRDIEDDWRDLAEDADGGMPNPLLLQLQKWGAFDPHQVYSQQELEDRTHETGVISEHAAFIRHYCRSLAENTPEKYKWMRQCAGTVIDL